MTIDICAFCGGRFISTHETYHIKERYSPDRKIYCSDACSQSIDAVKDIHGHDIRTMNFASGGKREGWVCLRCMNVWQREELEKTPIR